MCASEVFFSFLNQMTGVLRCLSTCLCAHLKTQIHNEVCCSASLRRGGGKNFTVIGTHVTSNNTAQKL